MGFYVSYVFLRLPHELRVIKFDLYFWFGNNVRPKWVVITLGILHIKSKLPYNSLTCHVNR